jgi:uncharacterized LabA/DUF88 family protein
MSRSKVTRFLIFLLGAVALLILVPQVTLAQTSSPSFPPEAFQRSIIFVDGTSVFYRFEEMKLCVSSFHDLFTRLLGGRSNPRIMRICWYTIQEKYDRLVKIHGENCLDKVRVIFGSGVPSRGSEPKEKGVDALLVADLVYHAAAKNMDYAQLVAIDLDFVFAIRRVEDFGCRSAVIALGQQPPIELQRGCDHYRFVERDYLRGLPGVTQR